MTTTTTKKIVKVFGEFGFRGGSVVYQIVARTGDARRVARLWSQLDTADGPEQESILATLRELDAILDA